MSERSLEVEKVVDATVGIPEIAKELPPEKQLALGAMIYAIALRRQSELVQKSKDGMLEIQEKNRNIAKVNAAMQAINACESGDLDLTNKPQLMEQLKQAKEAGAFIDLSKTKYSQEDRHRLLDNLRLSSDSLNMQTQTEMQQANLLSQVYENFTAARPITRAEHDAVMAIIKKWNG